MGDFAEASDGKFNSDSKDVLVGKGGSLQGNQRIINAIIQSTTYDIPSLVQGLMAERQADPTLNATWIKAEGNFQRSTNETYRQPGIPDELHIALIVYALKTFYAKFNAATRLLKSVAEVRNYPYKNYFKLLLIAVVRVTGSPSELPRDIKIYRGISGPWLEATEGSTIALQHFASCSRSRDKALEYADKFGKKTLLVIEGIMASGSDAGRLLGTPGCPNVICLDHINKNNNQECLIWPCEGFHVIRVADDHSESLRTIYLRA